MKTIHYLYATCLLFALMPAFSSCTLDADDDLANLESNVGAGTFSTLGTIIMDNQDITIESDLYGNLIPENPEIISSIDADSTGQRILAGFIFLNNPTDQSSLEGHYIRIVDLLYKVNTLPASDLRTLPEDNFGNDPLQITDVSISKKHLNIQYVYEGSKHIQHGVNLVLTNQSELNANGLLPVEFRHDAYNDSPNQSMESIVSFTLESIAECQSADFKGFRIIYNSGANSQAEWRVFVK